MDKKKLRYAILKTLEENKDPFIVLESDEIAKEDIFKQGKFLDQESYITKNTYASNTIYWWGELTEKGEEFLEKNSTFAKAYSVAKEIREWLPFLLENDICVIMSILKHGCQQSAGIFYFM